MSKRLAIELALLSKSCREHGIRHSKRLREKLVEWEDESLPDCVPPKPDWVNYEWPSSGIVKFESDWHCAEWNPWK